jgi:DNA-directed RNA polymerase I and III subunit RPAC2
MSANEVKIKKAPYELQIRGTGHPGSRTFAIGDEDHTLGNALRHILMNDSNVSFAGYSVPHPSEPVVHIRVQTAETKRSLSSLGNDDNGRRKAIDVLKDACETLITQCDFILDDLEALIPEVKEDRLRLEEIQQNDGYYDEEDNLGEMEEDELQAGDDDEYMEEEY